MKKRFTAFVLMCFMLIAYIPVRAEGEVMVSSPEFQGSGINSFGGLCKGAVRSSVSVSNTTKTPVNAMLIAVLIKDGNIASIALKSAQAAPEASVELAVRTIIPDDNIYTLKLLCWDDNMNQLCNPFILENYNPMLYNFNPSALITGFDSDETPDLYVWADTEYGASAEVSVDSGGVSNSALRMDYNRQHYGCQVQKPINSDWSGYDGLSFDIKGTQNSIVYVRLNDGSKTWQYAANVSQDWQTLKVNFTDFDGINLENIKSLTFFVHSNGASDRSGEGYFLVDNLILTSPVRSIAVLQVLTNRLGSCYTNDDITLYASVCGFNNSAQTVTLNCEIENYLGERTYLPKQEIEIDKNEFKNVPVNIKLSEYGVFKFRAELNGSYAETEFVHIPQINNIASPDGYKQGYSLHFDSLKTERQIIDEADMLKMQGCSIVRQDFLWDLIEKSDGEYDWGFYDKIVDILTERDIEILGLITYSNEQNSSMNLYNGAGKGKYRRYPPVDLEKWGKYVYDTVSRYKGRINRWEIWNEANIFYWEQDPSINHNVDKYRAEAYLPLLKVSYLAAKSADPSCIVTMSGMSDIGVDFVNNLIRGGGKDYMDVLNIHPYMASSVEITDTWSDRNFEKKILHTRSKTPELPIYVTEWGWSKNKGIPLDDTAVWNAKGIVYLRSAGVEVNTMYSFNLLTDDGMGHIMPCINGQPTPQFAVVAASNYLLGGRRCVGALSGMEQPFFGSDTFAAYFESESEKPIIALWLTNENITKTVKIKTDENIVVYDMYGNAETVQPVNGAVSLTLDNKPIYIEGDIYNLKEWAKLRFEQTESSERNTKSIVQARTDYFFSTERILKKDETYTLNIRIVNYSGFDVNGALAFDGIPQEWLSCRNVEYSAENGKSAIVSVDITPDTVIYGKIYKLTVYDPENNNLEEMTYFFEGE